MIFSSQLRRSHSHTMSCVPLTIPEYNYPSPPFAEWLGNSMEWSGYSPLTLIFFLSQTLWKNDRAVKTTAVARGSRHDRLNILICGRVFVVNRIWSASSERDAGALLSRANRFSQLRFLILQLCTHEGTFKYSITIATAPTFHRVSLLLTSAQVFIKYLTRITI